MDSTEFIVVSPGISLNKASLKKKLIENKEKIITDLDLFYLLNPKIKTIVITGTNGKSTTCKILEHVLKKNNTNVINDILEIIKENNIKGIVIGNPINMDGSKGPSSQSAKDFAKNLSNNISIPIVMWDERLSSQGAFNLSSNLNINTSKKVKKLDQNAASFILQGAIDYIIR